MPTLLTWLKEFLFGLLFLSSFAGFIVGLVGITGGAFKVKSKLQEAEVKHVEYALQCGEPNPESETSCENQPEKQYTVDLQVKIEGIASLQPITISMDSIPEVGQKIPVHVILSTAYSGFRYRVELNEFEVINKLMWAPVVICAVLLFALGQMKMNED